nr:HTH-type transcriptional regulator protein ptxE [Ipomoea batatas]
MGICTSCESTSVATAKLILTDGRLEEFSYPVKASYVLQKDPTIFICNSDEMDFGDVVSAISGDEELQPGQLYFALPLSRLKRRLQAEEMAALAVKASSALTKSGGGACCDKKCGCRRKTLDFPLEKGSKAAPAAGDGSNAGRSSNGRRRSGKFAAKLSAIPE